MARVYLMTGGNVGRADVALRSAERLINRHVGAVLRGSKVWRTEPWGFSGGEMFLNQALEVDTDLSPEELLEEVQAIERMLGRDRQLEAMEKRESGERYASRTMDIDIILYDDLVVELPHLSIPHPLMQERGFVLGPMCELVPEKVHPLSGVTLSELYDRLKRSEG